MKIFCVGRNYIAHAMELENEIPEEPVIFIKPRSALLKPKYRYYYPAFTNELHYEAELAVRICKNGAHIEKRKAHYYYDAFTVGIDFTARDVQQKLKKKGLPWEKAKSFDNSAVIGEWIPKSEFVNSNGIKFSLYKNDELVQNGNTANMIFTIEDIIAEITKYFAINIGDIIFTGTPEGVGEVLPFDGLTGYLGDRQVLNLPIE